MSIRFLKRTSVLILCCLLVFACTTPKKQETLKSLRQNHYNFSNLKKVYYKGLTVKLPVYFENEFGKYHLLKKDGLSLYNPETGIYFSIERFNPEEVEDILFTFKEGTTNLDAIHTHYTDLRAHSLAKPKVSVLSDNFKNAPLKGFFQYIEGNQYGAYSANCMYMYSTVEKKVGDKVYYFVVQLITPSDLSKYLNDDFLRLIHAAH